MAEEQKLASGSGALQNVFGTGDENIRLLEKLMRVRVALRGGDIVVEGEEERDVDNTREILKSSARWPKRASAWTRRWCSTP